MKNLNRKLKLYALSLLSFISISCFESDKRPEVIEKLVNKILLETNKRHDISIGQNYYELDKKFAYPDIMKKYVDTTDVKFVLVDNKPYIDDQSNLGKEDCLFVYTKDNKGRTSFMIDRGINGLYDNEGLTIINYSEGLGKGIYLHIGKSFDNMGYDSYYNGLAGLVVNPSYYPEVKLVQ